MIYFIGYVVTALIVADFIVGFAHWLEDTYCWEQMPIPVIGRVCAINIGHHKDPTRMGEEGFFSRNFSAWVTAAIVSLVFYFLGWLSWFFVLAAVFASFGNQVHYWCHMRDLPWFPTLLRRAELIHSQKQHALHHKHPETHYCLLTSWLNPFLDYFGFWRLLERRVEDLTGIKPKRFGVEKRSVAN